jgi:hypothetical protein
MQGLYNSVDTRSDGGLSDAELGAMASMKLPRDENGVLIPPYLRTDAPFGTGSETRTISPPHTGPPASPAHEEVVVDPKQLASMVPGLGGLGSMNGAMSKQRMAEIAASLT